MYVLNTHNTFIIDLLLSESVADGRTDDGVANPHISIPVCIWIRRLNWLEKDIGVLPDLMSYLQQFLSNANYPLQFCVLIVYVIYFKTSSALNLFVGKRLCLNNGNSFVAAMIMSSVLIIFFFFHNVFKSYIWI